jgi:flavin reductase (DIM6/NTAB) family NADH-FMN oxidoreductase RutF
MTSPDAVPGVPGSSEPDAGASRYEAARAAFSGVAMPVVILGAAHAGERSCATGTVMYVSLAPPEVAVAMHPGSRTTGLIRAAGELSISILGADQAELAVRAGRSSGGPDKFVAAGIEVLEPPPGFAAPGVIGSIDVLWCRVTAELETGDHIVIIARVDQHLSLDPSRRPLLRLGRRYVATGDPVIEADTDKYPV